MTVEVRLTEKDFFSAQLLNIRPKPLVRIALWVGVTIMAVLFIAEVWAISRAGVLPRGWWILPAGVAYGAILFFFILPWRVGRIFRQNPGLAAPTRTTFDDEGLLLDSSRGQLRFRWNALKKWKHNRDLLLVYHSPTLFHMLPRRCFNSAADFDALVSSLEKHLGPAEA